MKNPLEKDEHPNVVSLEKVEELRRRKREAKESTDRPRNIQEAEQRILSERLAYKEKEEALHAFESKHIVVVEGQYPGPQDLADGVLDLIESKIHGLENELPVNEETATLPERERAREIREEIDSLKNDSEAIMGLADDCRTHIAAASAAEDDLYRLAGEEGMRAFLFSLAGPDLSEDARAGINITVDAARERVEERLKTGGKVFESDVAETENFPGVLPFLEDDDKDD